MTSRIWVEDLPKHGKLDLAPAAIISLSVARLEQHCAFKFDDDGVDDLDHYRAAYFRVAGYVVALIHHDGEPETDITIYLPRGLGQREIDKSLSKLLRGLSLSDEVVTWKELHEAQQSA